jgi:hypothetical protein
LLALTCAGWLLVATMGLWWSWLWTRLGLISVPVDTLVWVVALILTVLSAPVLWHRFHRAWVVVFLVAALVVGGTAVVLTPWHAVLNKAWTRVTCGAGDCLPPQPPRPLYHWRIVQPK